MSLIVDILWISGFAAVGALGLRCVADGGPVDHVRDLEREAAGGVAAWLRQVPGQGAGAVGAAGVAGAVGSYRGRFEREKTERQPEVLQ